MWTFTVTWQYARRIRQNSYFEGVAKRGSEMVSPIISFTRRENVPFAAPSPLTNSRSILPQKLQEFRGSVELEPNLVGTQLLPRNRTTSDQCCIYYIKSRFTNCLKISFLHLRGRNAYFHAGFVQVVKDQSSPNKRLLQHQPKEILYKRQSLCKLLELSL